jgi:hypothetical protein
MMAQPNRVTLADYQKRAPTQFERGLVKTYLGAFPAMKTVPFVKNDSLNVKWRTRTSVPTLGKRHINQPFASSVAHTDAEAMVLSLYGTYLDIDTEILSEPGGVEEQSDQVSAHVEGLSLQIADDFINGDEAQDPAAFNGLKALMATLPARQTIAANLDLDDEVNRKANAFALLRVVQTGVQRIQQGTGGKKPSAMLVDDDLEIYMADAFRQNAGIWSTQQDGDRMVNTIFGVPIVPMGFDNDENPIIGPNHDGDGKTSIYLVQWGEEAVHFVYKYLLRTGKPALLDDQVTSRIKLDMALAPRIKNPRAAVRITGLDITA